MRQGTIGRREALAMCASALAAAACSTTPPASAAAPATLLKGGHWFDGARFEARDGWSVAGRFTFSRPRSVQRTLDLSGLWIVPPYADAHNHGIGTGDATRDRAMVAAYVKAGVFYVQSMGNLPLSGGDKAALGLNQPGGMDAIFAQGTLTGYGGHPMGIIRDVLLRQGYFPGRTLDSLKDSRFYEIDSEEELRAKWPGILASQADLIKFFLFNSDEYARRREDPAFFGRRGLDPRLARVVVQLAHAEGLRAAAHVVNVADFRTALAAGVDILAHLPAEGMLTQADAEAVARAGVPVHTTCEFLTKLARNSPVESAAIHGRQGPNLAKLKAAGARMVIGSDDPADPTPGEIAHLREFGVFSDAELLDMWTRATVRSIFPDRRVGALREGYEASFLALEGDPLLDWSYTGRIATRFKQGEELGVGTAGESSS
jgi:imidazolonepropionase-like amidohydrolase